jgi:hypothetical protein
MHFAGATHAAAAATATATATHAASTTAHSAAATATTAGASHALLLRRTARAAPLRFIGEPELSMALLLRRRKLKVRTAVQTLQRLVRV